MFAASQGGGSSVAGSFATALWTGNTTARSITTGVDTSSHGGLVWVKNRSIYSDHILMDTERGTDRALTTRQGAYPVELSGYSTKFTNFTTTGFSLGSDDAFNASGNLFVAWSFRKKSRFFDVVKYTGTGSTATISHSLGVMPGLIIVADRDFEATYVWHRSFASGENLSLSTNQGGPFNNGYFPSVTSSSFDIAINTLSHNYVAYVFAHDDTSAGAIQCGTYTGNGSSSGPSVNLGWTPQFLLIKSSTGTLASHPGHWVMLDAARGMTASSNGVLIESTSPFTASKLAPSEESVVYVTQTATGFDVKSNSDNVNTNGNTYIYMAVRA